MRSIIADIPLLGWDRWKNALHGKFYCFANKQVALRINADLIEWIDATLRKVVEEELWKAG